jgi:hypothetical protein
MNKLPFYCSAYMNFPYTLPPLDYAYSALEPYVDNRETRVGRARERGPCA